MPTRQPRPRHGERPCAVRQIRKAKCGHCRQGDTAGGPMRVEHQRPLPQVHPFVGLDLAHVLEARAATGDDRTFLRWETVDGPIRRWSFLRFSDEVRHLASALHRRHVRVDVDVPVRPPRAARSGCARNPRLSSLGRNRFDDVDRASLRCRRCRSLGNDRDSDPGRDGIPRRDRYRGNDGAPYARVSSVGNRQRLRGCRAGRYWRAAGR